MSKFLKTIVNIILIGSILVSAGLLIPPFLGVTTVIVDDLDMETNLPIGSVTYGVEKKASELKIGDRVLMTELEAQNLYEVTAIQNDVYSLEDQLSIDGQSKDYQLNNLVKKVLLTVPFMGYISMALKTTEGLIIVGLVVVFVIILFILAEIWKKDDDEEEIAEEDQEDEKEDEKEEEESQLTKRQQKKAKKLEAKEAKKAEKTAKKEAKKSRKKGIEPTEGEFETVDEIAEPIIETVEEASEQKPSEINEQSLIEETSNSFAADIKDMMGDTSEEMEEVIENEISEEVTLEEEIQEEKIQEEKEPVEEKKLAIPVYTKEELLAKAEKAGEVPVVRKDEYSGITIIDYSDIL